MALSHLHLYVFRASHHLKSWRTNKPMPWPPVSLQPLTPIFLVKSLKELLNWVSLFPHFPLAPRLSDHTFLSASTIPSNLFPRIAMTISSSNPKVTFHLTCLLMAFDRINNPSFPWFSLMPSFLHFPIPREVLPHSRCLISIHAWTKKLHPFPLYAYFPFCSLSFFILPCLESESCPLEGNGEGFLILTLPCMSEKQWSEYQ